MSERNKVSTVNLKSMIWMNIFTSLILSTIGLLVALVLAYYIYQQYAFQGYETIYVLAQIIKHYLPVLFVFVWLIDIIIVIWLNRKKSLDYLDLMVDASRQLIAVDDELIHLPGELREVENQMNQVKQEAIRNARLAREAEQRKNDLIVYLAHDLKTPLTSVIGYLTLLRDELQISEELREKYLSISLDKAEHLEDLINEFFEITRFNLSQLTLEASKVNLTRMLEQILYEFQPLLATKNLQCSLQAADDIEIKCDINKMERVFDNLIRNAVNYSFANSTIEIAVEQKTDGTYMRFRNHGNTISKDKLSRIFEQFYRLDTSRGTKTGGAGLGLAIAKEIIELHHGTISAASENEIIIFAVYLPMLS